MLVSSGSFKISTRRFCKVDVPALDVNNDQQNGRKLQIINIHGKGPTHVEGLFRKQSCCF